METVNLGIRVDYPLEHECSCCGCSCMAQLVGPLSEEEHQSCVDAHRDLAGDGVMDKVVNPIMKGIRPDGSCLHFLNFPGKRCIFLDENNLCRIHGKFGSARKPVACRSFPKIAIRTEEEIRIGIKPYCYNNDKVCNLEPVEEDYLDRYCADEIRAAELRELVEHSAFRRVTQGLDGAEAEEANRLEALVLGWIESDLPYPGLMKSLLTGNECGDAEFSGHFIVRLQEILCDAAKPLAQEIEKLGDTVHANHARDLCHQMELPLEHFEILGREHRFGKYARVALYQAVFLRETTRFPAVSVGAFALGLGALAAAQDPERCGAHLTAWMRLMAQTKLFTMLFPSPGILSEFM